ncbi:MAG TPA: hypothetical protein VN880_07920 [Solirubrobacteraceae bacterium]|nr:hypothetical protein [Solirubrobacteraceae bacterium]
MSSAVAAAAGLPASAGSYDLGSQLMLRLFGETTDANASFAAARGDRASESPLRELALAIPSAGATPLASASATAAAFGQSRLTLGDLYDASSAARFSPASPLNDDIVALMPSSALFTASYQPVTPEPSISPAPGTLAFAPVTAAAGDESLPATAKAAFVPSTTQLGPVRFEGHSDSATLQTPQLDLRDNTYGARANLDLRAGKRDLNLNVSSEYDQVASGGANAFTASTLNAASWQLPGAPLVLPNDAGLNRLSLGAGLAVPVVPGLTLNLNYAAQRLYNGYGQPGLLNLDTINNTYGGKLTFNLPSTSSSLSISAYQDRFQDSLLPINGSTQTREDVNFTVKF